MTDINGRAERALEVLRMTSTNMFAGDKVQEIRAALTASREQQAEIGMLKTDNELLTARVQSHSDRFAPQHNALIAERDRLKAASKALTDKFNYEYEIFKAGDITADYSLCVGLDDLLPLFRALSSIHDGGE